MYWTAFSGTLPQADVGLAFIAVGTLTAAAGALMAFAQRDLKRLLAYSTIAHMGLFTMAVAAMSPDGMGGAALYVAGHAGVKGALFLLAGTILNRYGNVDELRLYGRGRQDRTLAVLYFLAASGLAGLPPFGTALGHSMSQDAISAAGYSWGPAVYVLVSAVAGGAVLRAGLRVYFGVGPPPDTRESEEESTGSAEKRETQQLDRTPITMIAAIAVLVAGALAAGLLPGAHDAFASAGQRFTDGTGYDRQALFHAAAGAVRLPPASDWTLTGVGLGLLSAVLALGLALAGLDPRQLPAAVRAAGRPLAPVMGGLHRLHSGHVGDYIAWLLAGVAGLAALIGLPLL